MKIQRVRGSTIFDTIKVFLCAQKRENGSKASVCLWMWVKKKREKKEIIKKEQNKNNLVYKRQMSLL